MDPITKMTHWLQSKSEGYFRESQSGGFSGHVSTPYGIVTVWSLVVPNDSHPVVPACGFIIIWHGYGHFYKTTRAYKPYTRLGLVRIAQQFAAKIAATPYVVYASL